MNRRSFIALGLSGLSVGGITGLSHFTQPSIAVSYNSIDTNTVKNTAVNSDNLIFNIDNIQINANKISKVDQNINLSLQIDTDNIQNYKTVKEYAFRLESGDDNINIDALNFNLANANIDISNSRYVNARLKVSHSQVETAYSSTISVVIPAGKIYESKFDSGVEDWASKGYYCNFDFDDRECTDIYYDPKRYDSSGDRLGVVGRYNSGRGITHPKSIGQNINDWQLEYSADIDTSTQQQNRPTGGFHTGDDVNNYNSRRTPKYGVWFEDEGSTVEVRAYDGSSTVTQSKSYNPSKYSGVSDINDGIWSFKVISSQDNKLTKIKIWEKSSGEPSSWTYEYNDRYLPGRPGFYNVGGFNGGSRTCWYNKYVLKNV